MFMCICMYICVGACKLVYECLFANNPFMFFFFFFFLLCVNVCSSNEKSNILKSS